MILFFIFFSPLQALKEESGGEGLVGLKQKIKTEAERLDVMDKAAGVLAELLFDGNILQQIKEYRSLFLVVCGSLRGSLVYRCFLCGV